jgi:hypothetical protein
MTAAAVITVAPGASFTADVSSAVDGRAVAQVIIDEQDVQGNLIDWLQLALGEIPAVNAQVWVIARSENLTDVLTDGDEIFGAGSRLGITTWETGGRGNEGFSGDVRYLVVWKAGPSTRAIALGKVTRNVRRPITRRGRKMRTLLFPAGALRFDDSRPDSIHHAADHGQVRIEAMTILDGENWGDVQITAPFLLDQAALDAALKEGSRVSIVGAGDGTQLFCVGTAESGRPFPVILSPRLSNVESVAEAVRRTKQVTGRRVVRAIPETLAELVIAAGSRRGELVLSVGGPCAAIAAGAVAGNRDVVHVAVNPAAAELAGERILAVGGNVQVTTMPHITIGR